MISTIAQWLCGLFGHDEMLCFKPHRLTLKCVSCGHETPGWLITEDSDESDHDSVGIRFGRLLDRRSQS